jgi:hypothetical protein
VHYTAELRRLYEEEKPKRAPISGGRPIFLKAQHVLKCQFGKAEPPVLPETWSAAVYEKYCWPPEQADPDWQRQSFRLFLEIRRGAHSFVLDIHDKRDPWVGATFKAKAKIFRFPTPLNLPVSTYLVYDDRLTNQTLCRWLGLLLAQRSFLTDEEEGEVIRAFFTHGMVDAANAFLAYKRVKRNFLQPIGDRLSFPAHYGSTLRAIRREEVFMTSGDSHQVGTDAEDLVSLKLLRRQEPQLHRAILDRIAKGTIATTVVDRRIYVSAGAVTKVELARQANALKREPKRYPKERRRWVTLMTRTGIKRKSAERKLKRWINTLGLSVEEIEASAVKGELVRLPSDS